MSTILQVTSNLPTLRTNVQNAIKSMEILSKHFDDKGFGRMFADIFKGLLRYNSTQKCWYYYDGKVWKEDLSTAKTKEYAKIFSDELNIFYEGVGLAERDMREIYKLNSHAKRNTVMAEANSIDDVKTEDFDKDIFLLNCQNGTVDLRTGELRPHNADDLLSKIADVYYDSSATCERWIQFMNEVMEGNNEMIDYLQRILGICLTGETKEEEFYIFYGPGTRNGKSTLLETIRRLLGSTKGYAVNVDTSTFSARARTAGAPSSDKARLAGARLATVNEWHKNTEIDASVIKSVTGGDRQTGRFMRQNDFEYTPEYKLIINANHLPNISDDTLFSSDRVRVILFNRHFSEEEQDKTLKNTLRQRESLSGILNWLLEGLRKYHEEGLPLPQLVIEETAKYREDCDKIGCFMTDCLEESANNTTFKEVYEVYKKWTVQNGCGCEKLSRFKQQLGQRLTIAKNASVGTTGNKTTGYNVVMGYTIVAEYQEELSQSKRPNRYGIRDTGYVSGTDGTDDPIDMF